jgi:hypothetical protein
MTMKVTITWQNANPNTIWGKLAAKLGREPTNAEAADEVKRILFEAHCEAAEAGKLRYQRGLLP